MSQYGGAQPMQYESGMQMQPQQQPMIVPAGPMYPAYQPQPARNEGKSVLVIAGICIGVATAICCICVVLPIVIVASMGGFGGGNSTEEKPELPANVGSMLADLSPELATELAQLNNQVSGKSGSSEPPMDSDLQQKIEDANNGNDQALKSCIKHGDTNAEKRSCFSTTTTPTTDAMTVDIFSSTTP